MLLVEAGVTGARTTLEFDLCYRPEVPASRQDTERGRDGIGQFVKVGAHTNSPLEGAWSLLCRSRASSVTVCFTTVFGFIKRVGVSC